MFTKAELIEKGRHYFEDKNIKVMLATTDGNFFYEASKNYADSHAKTKKIEVVTITRVEAFAKKEAPVEATKDKPDEKEEVKKDKPKVDELAALRKEVKKLGVKGSHLMGKKRLKEEIELKNN